MRLTLFLAQNLIEFSFALDMLLNRMETKLFYEYYLNYFVHFTLLPLKTINLYDKIEPPVQMINNFFFFFVLFLFAFTTINTSISRCDLNMNTYV